MPWKLPEGDAELLKLATGYPYPAPDGSYLFFGGTARALDKGTGDPALYRDRTPVIGHGSNRAPEQLRRKFGAAARIPVSRAWLEGYDVVYSAHMTRYGAIAANLCHVPGTRVEVWITWLDEAQLSFMHATELGAEIYRFGRLVGVRLALEAGPTEAIEEAGVYLSTCGYLARDGAPLALAAVAAEGRRCAGLHQAEALALVRDRHRPGRSIEAMVLAKIREPALRQALIAEMRAQALPPDAPHFEPLDVLGPS